MTKDRIYQLGIGVLGLNADDLLDMTPRQFFNGLTGYYKQEEMRMETQRNILFAGFRFNASSVGAGFSGKLSKHLSNHKFPWEVDQDKLKDEGSEYISYDKIAGSLNMISESNK